MTLEQRKIVDKCAAMIKLAFPAIAGKVEFKLLIGRKDVPWTITTYGVHNSEHYRGDAEPG